MSAQQYSNISCSDQGGVTKKKRNTQEREHSTEPENTFNDNHQHSHNTSPGPAVCLGSQSCSLVKCCQIQQKQTPKQTTNHNHHTLFTLILHCSYNNLLNMMSEMRTAPKRDYISKIPQFPVGALHVKQRHLPEQDCRKRNRPRLRSKLNKPESYVL